MVRRFLIRVLLRIVFGDIRRPRVIVVASNIDFGIACDPNADREIRKAAWTRYEVECWYLAYRDKALLIRHMDDTRIGSNGETMQQLVRQRLQAGLPNSSGIDTSQNLLRA